MRSVTRRYALGAIGSAALAPVVPGFAVPPAASELPPWITGKIAVPGGDVTWRTFGGGKGLPLLMVHGGPGPLGSKLLQFEHVLGDERQLITWDQLDTGDSDQPRDPANWRLERFVRELEIVRNRFAPGPVHVMGGSTGSSIIMEWMITHKPENVASLILMCPTLDRRVLEARRAAQQGLSAASAAALADFERTGQFRPDTARALAEYSRTFILRHPPPGVRDDQPDFEIIRALTPDLASRDRATPLRDLSQPVLFARGAFDWVRDEDVRAYAAMCRDAEVVTIPDAAHLAFLDNPAAWHKAVRAFLRRVESALAAA